MPSYVLRDSYIGSGDTSQGNVGSAFSKCMQTFVASSDYKLYVVGLDTGTSNPPVSLPGGIYSVSGGFPNQKLASFTYVIPNWSVPSQWNYASLDTPLQLNQGTQYAIQLDDNGSPGTSFTRIIGTRTFDFDHYPDGVTYLWDTRIPGWTQLFGSGYMDLHFELYTIGFTLTSPEDGVTNQSINTDWLKEMIWEDEDDPFPRSAYTVHFSVDGGFNFDPQNDRSRYSIITYKMWLGITLDYSTTYYWFVRKDNGDETFTDTDVWSFTTIDYQPPGYSTREKIPYGGGEPITVPTGENNMMSVNRLIVAGDNSIFYEDV